jgi:hypothetical protein
VVSLQVRNLSQGRGEGYLSICLPADSYHPMALSMNYARARGG